MTKRRVLLVVAVALLGAAGFVSVDRCGEWPQTPPRLTQLARGKGALVAGSAKVPVSLPGPVTVGGYGPFRKTTSAGDTTFARATLVEVGGTRVALVSLDVLLLTRPLVAAIRAGQPFPVIVTATHTHSAVGQFDRRLASQLGALGTFEADVEAALIRAARAAIEQSALQMKASTLSTRTFDTSSFTRARSGQAHDTRGLELRFHSANDAQPHTRWLLLAAHPTLAQRRSDTLDTDWPGAVADAAGPVTLVLQTSVGNASIERSAADSKAAVVTQLSAVLAASEEQACASDTLDVVGAELSLPHPDGSRLAPGPFSRPVENVLCAASEQDAEVMYLRLGCLSLLALPVEPTFETAQRLEAMTGVNRVVGLANGYVGYLEPAEVVTQGTGEAKRQWFGPELLERFGRAALLTRLEDPH